MLILCEEVRLRGLWVTTLQCVRARGDLPTFPLFPVCPLTVHDGESLDP